jgi:hypothetical protein
MFWNIILAIISSAGGIYLLLKMEKVELGEYSAKVLSIIVLYVLYFQSLTLMNTYTKIILPVVLGILGIYFALELYKNKDEEFRYIFQQSWKLALSTVLFGVSGYFLNLLPV